MKSTFTQLVVIICLLIPAFTQAVNNWDPCENSTEKYTIPLTAGATYTWSVSSGGVITSAIGNCAWVFWVVPGTDTITVVENLSGGGSNTTTQVITVHPLPKPVIVPSFTTTCASDTSGQGSGHNPDKRSCTTACDSMTITYSTLPIAGSSWSWSINGGTIVGSSTNNSVDVIWGNVGSGDISVVETDIWGCSDSTSLCIEIIESPNAAFTVQATACANSNIPFLDLSTGGIVDWDWYFGDGNTSDDQNPVHSYSAGGTYTITLVVFNECYCSDTATFDINIDFDPGPEIVCPTTICADSCATYSTPANCGTFNWTVTGGTITGGIGTNTIDVCWGSGPIGKIELSVSGCSPTLCPNPTVVYIPIIGPNPQITGPDPVCEFTTHTYCLPTFPGSIYTWNVPAGDGMIISGQNTQCIDVSWYGGPTGTIYVTVVNELLGCEGADTLTIDILPEFSAFANLDEVCLGDTLDFFAFPGPDFTWVPTGGFVLTGQNSGNAQIVFNTAGNQSVVVYPTIASQYCNDTIILNVNVVTIEKPDSIVGDDPICPGETASYTAFSSIPGVTYEWFVQNGTPASGSGNPFSVTWGSSGPWCISVRHRMIDAPGCPSDTITKCVGTYPAPVASVSGPSTVCANDLSTYIVTSVTNASYVWSVSGTDDGSVISGQGTTNAGVQWNNNPGPSTVSVTITVCSNTIVVNFPVTVFPQPSPVIAQTGILCPGGSVTLDAGVFSGYLWSTSETTQTINVSSEANYAVTVTDGNGCQNVASIFVQEQPQPIASISTQAKTQYCIGELINATLVALTNPDYSYAWSTGASTNSITVTSPGTYCVTITSVSAGCPAVDCISITATTCTGVPCPNCPPPCNSPGFVGFGAGPQNGSCNTIDFINTSSAFGFDFTWFFGDGSTLFQPTLTNPTSHTYALAGYYTVGLMGNFADPFTLDTCLKFLETSITIPAAAGFDYLVGCEGEATTFVDLSTALPGITYTHFWEFGDGGFSTSSSPSHVYNTCGLYNVTLTITTSTCTSKIVLPVFIPCPPAANFTVSAPACEGSPVAFTDLSTGSVFTWDWDFGDGASSTIPNPLHTYLNDGPYIVTLIVVDVKGCADTSVQTISILPVTPDTISYIGSLILCDGDSDTLWAPILPPPGGSYLWSTGSTNSSIIVSTTGDYSVTVTQGNGCQYVAGPVKVIFNPNPTAIITADPGATVCLGDQVLLSTTQGVGYTYQWWQNPGMIAAGNNSSMYANSFNTHDYIVAIQDANGCVDTSAPFTVTILLPPTVTITPQSTPFFCAGGSVDLMAIGSPGVIAYNWSTGASTQTITAEENGLYIVTVTDSNGCQGTATFNVTVYPLPDLSLVLTGCIEICLPDTLPGPVGYPSYQWQLNGTNVNASDCGTCQNLPITQAGIYNLIVVTSNGCTDTSDALDVVELPCDSSDCYAATDPVFKKVLTSTSIVNQNTVWEGHYYFGPGVVLTIDGGTFDVTNVDIVFDTCAGILFRNGAFLRANNSVFRPCDITKSWRGFEFRSSSKGIINESTFKNAQRALFFIGGGQNSYARVTNNLFNNCKFGVLTANTTFTEAITGNTFVHDNININFDNNPCPTYVFFSNTYKGMLGFNTSFTGLISQNDFINSSEAGSNKRMHGIWFFRSSATISNNNFTNMYRAMDMAISSNLIIDHNEIEVTRSFSPVEHQLRFSNCRDVTISGNSIQNATPYTQFTLGNSAIYTEKCNFFTIEENYIEGYEASIINRKLGESLVIDNEIKNGKLYGIYDENSQSVDVACNEINMDLNASLNVVGIANFQTATGDRLMKFRSNCIVETDEALYLDASASGTPLPYIKNNYLYNYTGYGVRNFDFAGSIGSAATGYAVAGRNSFISNNIPNGSIDVFSNTPMVVAGNYGVSTVSAGVTTVGTGLYNSTASCGHQIGTISSEIGADEICDPNIDPVGGVLLERNGANYRLSSGYLDAIKEIDEESRLEIVTGMLSMLNKDASLYERDRLYNDLIQSGLISKDLAWWSYDYHLMNDDYLLAKQALSQVASRDQDESEKLALENIFIDMNISGKDFWDISATDLQTLNTIDSREGEWSNFARDILMASRGDRDYRFAPLKMTRDASELVDPIQLDDLYMIAYPNPTRDQMTVSYHIPDLKDAELILTDLSGKVLMVNEITFNNSWINISLEGLSSGAYLLSIREGKANLKTIKLLKY